jgi:hypothetical protein
MKVYAGTAGSGYRRSNENASLVSAATRSHRIRRSMATDIMSTISKVESMANKASHISNTASSENSRPNRRRIHRLQLVSRCVLEACEDAQEEDLRNNLKFDQMRVEFRIGLWQILFENPRASF